MTFMSGPLTLHGIIAVRVNMTSKLGRGRVI